MIGSPDELLGAAKISSVEIKIVGESGDLVKRFAEKVNVLLQQNLVGQSCTVSFHDGEYTVVAQTAMSLAKIR